MHPNANNIRTTNTIATALERRAISELIRAELIRLCGHNSTGYEVAKDSLRKLLRQVGAR